MSRKKGYHLVGEKDFETIRTLLDAGLSQTKIRAITGRSAGVISMMRRSQTFEDYRNLVKEHLTKYKENQSEDKKAESPNSTENTDSGKLVEVLERINSNLERLVEAWESHPPKRGLFS